MPRKVPTTDLEFSEFASCSASLSVSRSSASLTDVCTQRFVAACLYPVLRFVKVVLFSGDLRSGSRCIPLLPRLTIGGVGVRR